MFSRLTGLALVAAVATPAAASASTVSVSAPPDAVATFRTGPGEVTNLTVSPVFAPPGSLAFKDIGGTLAAGAGCTAATPAVCSAPGFISSVEIRLGPGADKSSGGVISGRTTVYGNGGDDDIRAGGTFTNVIAGDGDDVVRAKSNVTSDVQGNAGDDTLYGAESSAVLSGGPNEDFLVGAASINSLTGGDGGDIFIGMAQGVSPSGSIDAGNNNDLVAFAPQNRGAWKITTGAGQDFVYTTGRGDTVNTGSGSDHIIARDGAADTVDCGSDFDWVWADTEDTVRGCEVVTYRATGAADDDPRVAAAIAKAQALAGITPAT
jgi:hypothetical protein